MNRKQICLTVSALLISIMAFNIVYSLMFQRTIQNNAHVHTIGLEIYQDEALTLPLTTINWGEVSPNIVYGVVGYFKNPQGDPIRLTLATANWVPIEALPYMTVAWDYDNSAIPVNQVRAINMTLVASDTVYGIGNFAFDIIVTANTAGD